VGESSICADSGCDAFQPLHYGCFRLHADDSFHLSAFLKHQQRWDALHMKARCRDGILVHVQFRHAHASRHFRCQFLAITGATSRQGPHHGAHKSSNTGSGERSTSAKNVASVTTTGLLAASRGVLQRPQTG
jgi:hypothetical protein